MKYFYSSAENEKHYLLSYLVSLSGVCVRERKQTPCNKNHELLFEYSACGSTRKTSHSYYKRFQESRHTRYKIYCGWMTIIAFFFFICALPSLVCCSIMKMDGTPVHRERLYDCAVALIHYEEAGLSVGEWLASWLQAIITPPTALSSQRGKLWDRIIGRGGFKSNNLFFSWWNLFIWSDLRWML